LFIEETNNLTAQRGAGRVNLDSEQFSSLVEAVMATANSDVIVLRSADNQFGSGPLSVDVESFENEKVFSAGQLLVSLSVVLQDQSQISDIRIEVVHLWQLARNKLLSKSVVDSVTPEAFAESPSTEGFTNQLLRLGNLGKINIGLIATSDIYISGPAQLELVILNN
jgi:hypothetical protein